MSNSWRRCGEVWRRALLGRGRLHRVGRLHPRPKPRQSLDKLTRMSSEQMQQMMQQMGLPTNAFMGPLLTPAMFPIMSPAMLMKAATDSTDAAKKTKA